MKNIAIFASHNGSSFDTLYEASINNILPINIALVISNNTNANILQKAHKLNIKNYIINDKLFENIDDEIYNLLIKYDCEYIFLAGYMKKISSLICENFKVLNSHPALLPSYGGAGMYGKYVHEAVIQNNETTSGVTIHEVNENYDEGAIIYQESLEVLKSDTAITLEKKIKDLEKNAVIKGFEICLK